jgi:uncharacterized membrane protein
MSFLAPLFFMALAGLAIPVLLHLTQREKKQIVQFPSLMFVRRIPYQSVRRRKIQHWLLLAVRLAALALIIAAFARPLWRQEAGGFVPGAGAREVVVLLDTSYSMGVGDRWARAQAAAADAFSGLGASDRGTVVLFASGADIALRSSNERARLVAVIDAAKVTAGATRYAPALKAAGSIVAESTLPRREVVLVSDFQRGGWRGEEGARLPAGVTLTPVSVDAPATRPNLSVTAVSMVRSTFANQDRVTVTAAVVNRSDEPVRDAVVKLDLGGIPVGTKSVSLEPAAGASVTFEPVTISGRNTRGTVTLGEDLLAADNAFHFVLSPSEPVRVILVDRGGADRGGTASALYLTQSLAIGEAPKFQVTMRAPDAVSDDDLRRAAVVVLNDVTVTSAVGRRLARFVDQGGGLFVAAGPRAGWPGDVDLLPASLGAPVDRSRGDSARMGAIEFGHPVFDPFRAARSGDFSTVHLFGYRSVSAVSGAQVIARFDGGAAAVLERRQGRGRVLLWASTLDPSWTDLPLKPVFLPFVQQSVRHVAAYREPVPWVTVGQVLETGAAGRTDQPSASRVLLTPSGQRVPLDDEAGDRVVEATEQGFYEIRGAGDDVSVVASNVDPAEADLTSIDPKEILAAASPETTVAAAGGRAQAVPLGPEAEERNQRLWWYLLCAGVVLLGLDTLISNRLARV